MLQFLHKILAFILAVVVLFSSFSFTVEKHICMGEVTDTSYFGHVDSCGMDDGDCDNKEFPLEKIQKENCCNDIQELIPGNQNEQQALQSLEIEQVQFILAFFREGYKTVATNGVFRIDASAQLMGQKSMMNPGGNNSSRDSRQHIGDIKDGKSEIRDDKAKEFTTGEYQCPMKCEGDKTYHKPGSCPECKMDLRELKKDLDSDKILHEEKDQ